MPASEKIEGYSNPAKAIFRRAFLLLVFVSIFLPSGSMLGVNVKLLVLFVVLLAFAFSRTSVLLSWVLVLLAFTIVLGSWLLYGSFLRSDELALALLQFKDIYVAFLIPFIGWVAIRRNIVRPYSILMSGAYAASAVGLVKIALEWVSWVYNIHYMTLAIFLEKLFDVQIMTMDIVEGLFRIQVPSDIAIPFLIFFLISVNRSSLCVGRLQYWAVLFLMLISGFLAFSRYIWVATLVLFVLWMLSRRRTFKSLALLFLSIILVSVVFMAPLSKIIAQRFSSEQVDSSDQVRIVQLRDLIDKTSASPWVGFGLGAYVSNNVRNQKLKYSYELQWNAWLVQLGVLGTGALFVASLIVLWPVLNRGDMRSVIVLGLALSLWLGSGLTNPYLTSSFAGVVFLFFLIYGVVLSRSHNLTPVPHA